MIRLALLILALASPAAAECSGRNLIDALQGPDRKALDEAVAVQPYAQGNVWRATRGAQEIVLVGTYHLNDTRLDAQMTALLPLLDDATILLVEAGPEEEKALVAHMAENPGLTIITDGPTLPEQLSQPDWTALASAARARGIPPFVAAKMKPWYLSMMLGVAPCAMGQSAALGLDKRLIGAAQTRQIPIKALEPWDTVLHLFSGMTQREQLDMIRMTLPMEPQSADYAVTLADSYFTGNARQMWEFMRLQAQTLPGYDATRADAEFAKTEHILMTSRNRGWLPILEEAALHGPVLAAFGALHLGGHDGVLDLLKREGYSIDPI